MTTASLRRVDPGPGPFDPRTLRREFPIFANNPALVFLDSGASAQKPRAVIDRIADYYRTDYANVHRGVYRLSARSTELFEEAREKVRRFLNAADAREIVFVRNTTEAINLVAQSWGPAFLKAGRRGVDQRTRASFQHRALAAAARPDRHPAGRGADRCDRRARYGRLRGAPVATHPARRDHPNRQRHRCSRSGRDDRQARASAGAPRC